MTTPRPCARMTLLRIGRMSRIQDTHGAYCAFPCVLLLPLTVLLLSCGLFRTASAQAVDVHDYSRITQVPRTEIDAWLKQEVAASGGDWSHDRYHLYIGFSTGHFGQDPVHAIAMRRIAFSLVNNSLSVGDRITPIAWEMSTWNVGPTIALTDQPASRTEFADQVPYAPHTGSRGGHDIERVLYETVTKAIPSDEVKSAIVLLLTNSNASQAPTGERADLFGADNPLLGDALRRGGYRLPLVRKEFRLLAGSQPVTVAVTALFPEHLVSLSGAPTGPRYPTFDRDTWKPSADRPQPSEALPNPTQSHMSSNVATGTSAPPPASRPGTPTWIWLILGLVIIIALVSLLRRRVPPDRDAITKPVAPSSNPVGIPIPGSLSISIGPNEQTVQPLTTASRWTIQRDATGAVSLVETGATPTVDAGQESAQATALARLDFDDQRNLRVGADSGAQFVELNGPDPANLDSRMLTIAPGKKAFCRIVPEGSAVKTRFEVAYNTAQKGSRA